MEFTMSVKNHTMDPQTPGSNPWDTLPLTAQHRAELINSGISWEVARDRGYRSSATKRELSLLGFKPMQLNPPGIIMPIHGMAMEITGYQHKPDFPRTGAEGKVVKYETPARSTSQLDVPRKARQWVRDPENSLWITEGIKKGDAGASQELAMVSITGVWNFRSKDVQAEFDQIPLKERTVYLAFDSDSRRNPNVRQALGRLAMILVHAGAIVSLVDIPEATEGIKAGLDDYFVAGGTARELTLSHATLFDATAAIAYGEERLVPVADLLHDSPATPDVLVPPGYTLTMTGIHGKSGQILPTPAIVTARFVDRVSRQESVEIAFLDRGAWQTRTVSRDVLATARKITDLSLSGLPVTSTNASRVVDWFAACLATNADTLPMTLTSSTLGWQGDRGFLLPGQFITDGDAERVIFASSDDGMGQYAAGFTSTGTLDGWRDAIRPVAEFSRVRFGLCAAFAAPMLEIFECPSFIVDYCGRTTGGKTTTLRIAGSVWGQTDPAQPSSIMTTFHSTRVFTERTATIASGLPVIVDDTQQAAKPGDIQNFLYDFANGQGRGRGSLTGVRATQHWRSVALISGESPATGATEAGGTKARTLTIWGMPFGTGAEAATIISSILNGIARNYGTAGPVFLQWVLAQRSEWPAWRARYERHKARCIARMGGGAVGGRLAAYIAAVEITAALAAEAGVLPWAPDETPDDLLGELAGEARGADAASEAFGAVEAWFVGRQDSFWRRGGSGSQPPGGWLGRWEPVARSSAQRTGEQDSWAWIAFLPDRLREALAASGFHDIDGIIREWADRGWLEIDAGDGKARRMKQIRMGKDMRAWCYVLRQSAVDTTRTAIDEGDG